VWRVETISTLQLMEPVHDELLGIECHGVTGTAHSHPNVMQYADGRLIEAEEVQPPSVWSAALDPVEECVMTLLQQAVLQMLAMATHDQVLTCERACQQPVPVLGRRVGYMTYPEALTSRYSNRGKVGQ